MRKKFIQLMELIKFCILALILSGIIVLSTNIIADDSTKITCIKLKQTQLFYFKCVAQWIVAIGFLLQLGIVSFNYSQIVCHVKQKFWQRKARGKFLFCFLNNNFFY